MRLLPGHEHDHPGIMTNGVGEECEAFLRGTLAEIHRADGHAPVWTWLNVVAHGDDATIAAIGGGGVDGSVEHATQRALVRAVLADGRDLAALQRDVLVPLE